MQHFKAISGPSSDLARSTGAEHEAETFRSDFPGAVFDIIAAVSEISPGRFAAAAGRRSSLAPLSR